MIGSLVQLRYEVTEPVGETPLFTIYRAKDRSSNADVNLRFVREPFSTETAFLDQLKSTVHQLGSIRAPGVERFSDMDDHEGAPFLVSESGAGQSFDQRLKRLAPYSVPVAISMALQILEGVKAVHDAGFVHGEVTSRNILVGSDGKASLLQPGLWVTYSASRLAGPAVLPHIAGYLAPEVSNGQMPSPASDVYSVGVLLFEMLAGRQPFSGDTPVALASKHLTAPVPGLRAINASVPQAVEELVKKAMAKDLADRYHSAQAMINDLRVMQEGLRFGRPLTWPVVAAAVPTATALASVPAARVEATKVGPKKYEPPKTEAPNLSQKRKLVDEPELSDRVPGWLTGIAYVFVCGLIVMISGWVYWNLTKPKPIKVPNVVGVQVVLAQDQLRAMGLTLRESRREFSERQPEGVILKLDPAPGADAREGATVSAVISGGSKFVEIPDLKGRTVDEARALLTGMDLEISEPIEQRRSRQIEPGRVLDTTPNARTKVERGSRIRIAISTNERDVAPAPGTARGSYLIRVTIPDLPTPVNVRVDINDANGARTVHEDRHRSGDSFEVEADGFGDPVFFKIFFDGDLVKSIQKSPKKAVGGE